MKDTDGTDQLKTEFDNEVGIPHSYKNIQVIDY